MMTHQFVGHHVSINCGSTLGHFQGCIEKVDGESQTITLSNPYKSGLKCDFSQVTLSANDIIDLSLLDEFMQADENHSKKESAITKLTNGHKLATKKNNRTSLSSNKPSEKNHKQAVSEGSSGASFQAATSYSPAKPTPHSFREQRHPHLKDHGKPKNKRDGDCFAIDHSEMKEDFDFEKNLALFDKLAVYDEMYSGSDGETRAAMRPRRKSERKFGHDENVLGTQAIVYRQIVTKEAVNDAVTEYYTDSGLVIPCITAATHNSLCCNAQDMGISIARQIEAFGINASQMALNVLGGSNRLHPRNSHQLPHVIVLAGPHMVGAQGLAAARCLANQNVHVNVFMANFVKMHDFVQDELRLLSLSGAKLINDVKDFPSSPVDLVITALEDDDSLIFIRQQSWYDSATRWCNANNAPIMCFCPPDNQGEEGPMMRMKWSICSVLPRSLTPAHGILYLLDLGFPRTVFSRVGIKYQSPFCSKPFIALHASR